MRRRRQKGERYSRGGSKVTRKLCLVRRNAEGSEHRVWLDGDWQVSGMEGQFQDALCQNSELSSSRKRAHVPPLLSEAAACLSHRPAWLTLRSDIVLLLQPLR